MSSQASVSDPSRSTFKIAFILIPHTVSQHSICRGTGSIGSGSERKRATNAHRPTTFWRSCESRGRYARAHWSLLKECEWFVRCIMPDHRRQRKLCLQLLTQALEILDRDPAAIHISKSADARSQRTPQRQFGSDTSCNAI